MLEKINRTRRPVPKIFYKKIAERILGKKYSLSLVFCGNKLIRKLNKACREKDKICGVLSFNFSKNSGEIFLNNNDNREKMLLLYIHSLLHLQGLKHGKDMEQKENRYFEKFLN